MDFVCRSTSGWVAAKKSVVSKCLFNLGECRRRTKHRTKSALKVSLYKERAEPGKQSENNAGFASATLAPTHKFTPPHPHPPLHLNCLYREGGGIEFLFVKQLFLNLPLFLSSVQPRKLVVFSDFPSIFFFPSAPQKEHLHMMSSLREGEGAHTKRR